MADVEFTFHGQVGLVTLNRPARRNAFTLPMLEAITAFIGRAGATDECRAIVLTGAGGSFCSGVDLSVAQELRSGPQEGRALDWKRLLFDHVHHVALAIERCDLPVIAAVDGPAYGAGMDLALMCDMRFVSDRAVFCESYINLGVVPGDGGCYYLPRIVGLPKALELLLGGETVAADEALRIGLANRVHPAGELIDRTLEFATKVARKSPVALRMTKRATMQSLSLDLRTSLDLISSHMGIVQTMAETADHFGAAGPARTTPP
jgi:enoyl-CoA hydratase/carnithine racemase